MSFCRGDTAYWLGAIEGRVLPLPAPLTMRVADGHTCRLGVMALKQEKYEARKAILPFIQAEEDARFLRDRQKFLDEEAEIMANVPGWKVGASVYNSERWRAPASIRIYADYQ
eukprot:c10056_g1_i1 orf=285-623(-)